MKQPNFDRESLTTEKRPWTKHDDQRVIDKVLQFLVEPRKLTPEDVELASLRRQYRLTTTDKGGSMDLVEPPVFSCNPPPDKPPWRQTAADVAAQRDALRPPDAWRRAPDIDHAFDVVVGSTEVGAEEMVPPNETPGEAPKRKDWLTADEFVKQFSPSERLKLFDTTIEGREVISTKRPNSDPVAPTCFVCGQPILEISLITAADGRKRHGDCWPFPIDERIKASLMKK